jgi:LuxR family maltose regulon positive regulatory protein
VWSRLSGNVEIEDGGYRILARLRQAQGDSAGALEALEQAHRLACERNLGPFVSARNAAYYVQIALEQGDLPTAMRWAERVTEDADGSAFYPHLGLAQPRLLIARGDKMAAAALLRACAGMAERNGWQYGLVAVCALQCLAAATPDEALRLLSAALSLAEPEGYVRTFLDLGQPMAALLRQAAIQGITPHYVDRLLQALDRESKPQMQEPALLSSS